MNKYIKVKSDVSLVRDMDSNAIVSQNKSEFDKFIKLSQKKYEEKRKFDNMRSDSVSYTHLTLPTKRIV